MISAILEIHVKVRSRTKILEGEHLPVELAHFFPVQLCIEVFGPVSVVQIACNRNEVLSLLNHQLFTEVHNLQSK